MTMRNLLLDLERSRQIVSLAVKCREGQTLGSVVSVGLDHVIFEQRKWQTGEVVDLLAFPLDQIEYISLRPTLDQETAQGLAFVVVDDDDPPCHVQA